MLITNGAQEAISLAVGLVAADGRRIAVESPGYPSALDAIVRAGGQPLAIERDAGGLRVDSLKQLLARHHVHALYIATSCNNPTGGRTAPHRRERIAALAADHELTVIEDTVLDELCFDGDPGAPLWALAPERVFAAGSLSKVAWGGLRVGWLRAPRPVILRLARIKAALNIGVGAFDQLAALAILDDYPQLCLQRRAQANRTCTQSWTHFAASYPSGTSRPPREAGHYGSPHPPAAAPRSPTPRCATASPSPPAARTAQTERSPITSEFATAPAHPSSRQPPKDSPPHGTRPRAQIQSLAPSAPKPTPTPACYIATSRPPGSPRDPESTQRVVETGRGSRRTPPLAEPCVRNRFTAARSKCGSSRAGDTGIEPSRSGRVSRPHCCGRLP